MSPSFHKVRTFLLVLNDIFRQLILEKHKAVTFIDDQFRYEMDRTSTNDTFNNSMAYQIDWLKFLFI